MAKFKFRLEVLLKLALNKEEEVKRELATWHKLIQEAEAKLKEIILDILKNQKEKSIIKDINKILIYENYLNRLRVNQEKVENELKYFEIEKDKTIIKLQDVIKERKILEKLKEKKYEQYLEEENRIEQKETDEIGTKIFLDGR